MSSALISEEAALDESIHYALAIDGLSPQAAAAFFHKTPLEITRIYERIEQANIGRFTSKAEASREKNIRRLERVIAQGAEGYETSKKPKTTTTTSADGSQQVKVEEKIPDPRFLNTQLEAVAQISRLTGAEAPKQVQISQHSLHEVYVNLQDLSDEDLASQAALSQLVQKRVLVLDQPRQPQLPAPLQTSEPEQQNLQQPDQTAEPPQTYHEHQSRENPASELSECFSDGQSALTRLAEEPTDIPPCSTEKNSTPSHQSAE